MLISPTPLHRALGRLDGDLAELLTQAVDQGVVETVDLDWKSTFPDSRNAKDKAEIVKDLTAMANSGGGLIVFGVAEEAGTSAAAGTVSVQGTAAELDQRIRQAAYSVQPPIMTVHTEMTTTDGGDEVFAAQVMPSRDTPHLVVEGNTFSVPIRHGPHTQFLGERDLEQAYRSRWTRNTERADALVELCEDMQDTYDPATGPALIAAAIPRYPRPDWLPQLSPEDARRLMGSTSFLMPSFSVGPWPGAILAQGMTLRPGLRSWVDTPDGLRTRLLHNGSVAVLVGGLGEASGDFGAPLLEGVIAELVALIQAVGDHHRQDAYDVRVVIAAAPANPLILRAKDPRVSVWQQARPENTVRRVTPILTTLAITSDSNDWPQMAGQIAADVLNQGGLSPTYLPVASPPA